MDTNIIPEGSSPGFWTAVSSAIGVAIFGGYKAYRTIKGDLREDKNTEAFDKYKDSLLLRIKELETNGENLAKERNSAMSAVGKLETEVEYLKKRIDEIQEQNRREIDRFKSENDKLLAQVKHLIELVNVDARYLEALDNVRHTFTQSNNKP